jgi:hypothetical protein
MVDARKPKDDRLPDAQPHGSTDTPSETAGPRNVDSPDLGGSFEENGQVRSHDGVGAGPGMEVLDEGLRAAREAERNSSAGS